MVKIKRKGLKRALFLFLNLNIILDLYFYDRGELKEKRTSKVLSKIEQLDN